jgi:hypothetical protein
MTEKEIVDLGGQSQLDKIASGEKLDAPIFHSEDCETCQEEAERQEHLCDLHCEDEQEDKQGSCYFPDEHRDRDYYDHLIP